MTRNHGLMVDGRQDIEKASLITHVINVHLVRLDGAPGYRIIRNANERMGLYKTLYSRSCSCGYCQLIRLVI